MVNKSVKSGNKLFNAKYVKFNINFCYRCMYTQISQSILVFSRTKTTSVHSRGCLQLQHACQFNQTSCRTLSGSKRCLRSSRRFLVSSNVGRTTQIIDEADKRKKGMTFSVCSFAHLLCVHKVFEEYVVIPFFFYLLTCTVSLHPFTEIPVRND